VRCSWRLVVPVLAATAGCGALLGAADNLGFGADAPGDAMPDGVEGGGDGPGAADADAGSTCVPDPESIQDARVGADVFYTTCGDAAGIDLLGDSLNCGVCGHSCLRQPCQSGQCVVQALLNLPGNLVAAADSTSLYVYSNDVVNQVPFDGGPASQLVSTADAGFDNPLVIGVRVDDVSAYVRVYTGGLLAVPIAGGNVEWTVSPGGFAGGPGGVAVAQDAVYVATLNNVYRIGKDGDASAPPLATTQGYAFDIAATPDGGKVFWLDEPARIVADAGPGALSVYDGFVRAVAQNLPSPIGLAVDEAYVYWADATMGAVYRLPLDATPTTPVETVAQVPAFPYVGGFGLDETHVYWFAKSAIFDSHLFKRAKCGGPVTELTAGVVQPLGVVVTNDSIYWGGNAIYRIAK
jgi:hypothetical protein